MSNIVKNEPEADINVLKNADPIESEQIAEDSNK